MKEWKRGKSRKRKKRKKERENRKENIKVQTLEKKISLCQKHEKKIVNETEKSTTRIRI